jgi:hypothetical protein
MEVPRCVVRIGLPRGKRDAEIVERVSCVARGVSDEHPTEPTVPSEPIDYVQVAPTTVVELDVDTSFEQDRWRHDHASSGFGQAGRRVKIDVDAEVGLPRTPGSARVG